MRAGEELNPYSALFLVSLSPAIRLFSTGLLNFSPPFFASFIPGFCLGDICFTPFLSKVLAANLEKSKILVCLYYTTMTIVKGYND